MPFSPGSQIITHWFTLEYYLIRSAPNDSLYFAILMILYTSPVWWVNHCLSQFMASIFFIVFCLPSAIQGDVNFVLLTFLTPLGRLSWRIKLLTNQQPTLWTPSCTSSLGMWEPANFRVVQNQDVPPHKKSRKPMYQSLLSFKAPQIWSKRRISSCSLTKSF